jgi:hypothetical protein
VFSSDSNVIEYVVLGLLDQTNPYPQIFICTMNHCQNILCSTKIFKNKHISIKLNIRLKNTIVDKMLTYASEIWILTNRDRKQMNIFERKVYRRILGPVYDN